MDDALLSFRKFLRFSLRTHRNLTIGTVDEAGLGEYQTLVALYQELCSTISFDGVQSESSERALQRCQISHEQLYSLLKALGYCRGVEMRNRSMVVYKLKRRFKKRQMERSQASYRDAVLLLKEVVTR